MDIEALLDNPELPTLPDIIVRLNHLLTENASLEEIADLVTQDQTLSTRALEIANSAWYRRDKPTEQIFDAISLIGLSALSRLILATAVTRVFDGIDSKLVSMDDHWRRSAGMAASASHISKHTGKIPPLLMFTSGLLSQIGKLVIYTTVPNVAVDILESCRLSGRPQHLCEEGLLGFTHADITAELFKRWQFPKSIYEPIKYYLKPELVQKDSSKLAPSILHLSYVAELLQFNQERGEECLQESKIILANVGIEEQQLRDIAKDIGPDIKSSLSMMGLCAA